MTIPRIDPATLWLNRRKAPLRREPRAHTIRAIALELARKAGSAGVTTADVARHGCTTSTAYNALQSLERRGLLRSPEGFDRIPREGRDGPRQRKRVWLLA